MQDIWKKARRIAKQLDSPQLRKLYRDQKAGDKGLDKAVEDLTKEIQDGFKHGKTPK